MLLVQIATTRKLQYENRKSIFVFQSFHKIVHSRRAAGAHLLADDAGDGFHVLEAPLLKIVLHRRDLLRQRVKIPVFARILVDLEPGIFDTVINQAGEFGTAAPSRQLFRRLCNASRLLAKIEK